VTESATPNTEHGDDDGYRARDTWYDIPEGTIPDMRCGGARHGEVYYPGVHEFRPQYFTAEVDDEGKLTQLRIWGRQLKADGSLGKRHLDFVWDF
jgi:hypothetical protein